MGRWVDLPGLRVPFALSVEGKLTPGRKVLTFLS
jgi:hypothetical protein